MNNRAKTPQLPMPFLGGAGSARLSRAVFGVPPKTPGPNYNPYGANQFGMQNCIGAMTAFATAPAQDARRAPSDAPYQPPVGLHSASRTPHPALFTRTIRNPQFSAAFTLLELLVVIVIIGLLATIGLPAIRGMTKSNAIIAANRQLLDDIAFTRASAIANHTTAYMVFIPPYIQNTTGAYPFPVPSNPYLQSRLTNLYTGQLTTYAVVTLRTAGDQPGNPTPRYLTDWRSLPPGVFIATNKFYTVPGYAPAFHSDISFPFPVSTNPAPTTTSYRLPYLAFNYLGQLASGSPSMPTLQPEYIPLGRGSILYAPGSGIDVVMDLQETPPGNTYYTNYNSPQAFNNQPFLGTEASVSYNQIYIDPLTGRARVQHQDVQ